MFKIDESYTRRQIHEKVGGSVQTYLPTVSGRVVCACLTKAMNPEAPDIILVGNKPRVIQAARQLAIQPDPIPIFLKQVSNAWIYVGMFSVKQATSRNEGLDKFNLAGRQNIELVLVMTRSPSS